MPWAWTSSSSASPPPPPGGAALAPDAAATSPVRPTPHPSSSTRRSFQGVPSQIPGATRRRRHGIGGSADEEEEEEEEGEAAATTSLAMRTPQSQREPPGQVSSAGVWTTVTDRTEPYLRNSKVKGASASVMRWFFGWFLAAAAPGCLPGRCGGLPGLPAAAMALLPVLRDAGCVMGDVLLASIRRSM